MLKKPPIYRNRIELLQGTLDLLILQTLRLGPRHDYGISRAIRTGSSDVAGGHRALTRAASSGARLMDRRGMEEVREPAAREGLPAHRAGKKQLLSERSRWEQLVGAIGGILGHEQS